MKRVFAILFFTLAFSSHCLASEEVCIKGGFEIVMQNVSISGWAPFVDSVPNAKYAFHLKFDPESDKGVFNSELLNPEAVVERQDESKLKMNEIWGPDTDYPITIIRPRCSGFSVSSEEGRDLSMTFSCQQRGVLEKIGNYFGVSHTSQFANFSSSIVDCSEAFEPEFE